MRRGEEVAYQKSDIGRINLDLLELLLLLLWLLATSKILHGLADSLVVDILGRRGFVVSPIELRQGGSRLTVLSRLRRGLDLILDIAGRGAFDDSWGLSVLGHVC